MWGTDLNGDCWNQMSFGIDGIGGLEVYDS